MKTRLRYSSGEIVTQVNESAGVGMAAAGIGVQPLPAARAGPVAPGPVNVIGTARHQLKRVWMDVLAKHSVITPAGDDVEHMFDDAVGDKGFAVVVEVEAPGICGAAGELLEDLLHRMIAPNAAVHCYALAIR